MRLRNEITGAVLEMPPPDMIGASVIRIDGEIIHRVLYSDEGEGSATLDDGRSFKCGEEFATFIKQLLRDFTG